MMRSWKHRWITATVACAAAAILGCETSSGKSIRTYEYSEEPPRARTAGERETADRDGEMVSPGEMVPPGQMVPPGSTRRDP